MEFCGSNTLEAYFKQDVKHSEKEIREKYLQVLTAVDFLHKNNIYHRDLSVKNILVTNKDQVKIVDFGLAVGDSEQRSDCCGTLAYLCPQMMLKEPYSPVSVDIWCLGVVLYAIHFGKHPFGGIWLFTQNLLVMEQETEWRRWI